MKCIVSPGLLAGAIESAAPVPWLQRGFCVGMVVGAVRGFVAAEGKKWGPLARALKVGSKTTSSP